MATSYGALCNDFYVNQKITLKMDLPTGRDTLLDFFERMRKSMPTMNRFKRYNGELALESARRDARYNWLALRRHSIRTGHVNPESLEQAMDYHKLVLELAPNYLSLSPLDIDFVELMYGFDLECDQNHDAVIFDALFGDSPLQNIMPANGSRILDVQPVFGHALNESGSLQAYYEVKSRPKSRRGSSKKYAGEPLSLFLTLRQYGPMGELDTLGTVMDGLHERLETLAAEKLVPSLLRPIAERITSSA
ncbi:MAG: hypothetical protein V3V20_08405 [Algisphaera sp.]